jgi:CheY-like chemotaxis protein
MKAKLKILLLEDNVTDAELVAAELGACGFTFNLESIRTEADLRKQMEEEIPDLILSDHGFPSFSGFKALKIVRETHPDLPFIFVSGSNDQGMVARMYEQGATDYVYKRDLGDLRSAVFQALQLKHEPLPVAPPKSVPAEPELNLQLPPVEPAKPILSTVYLLFCPECRRIWNELGKQVSVESYCDRHVEVVIRHYACADCVPTQRPG